MTTSKPEPIFYTSPWNREKEIRAPFWGASLDLGLHPFQVRLLKAKAGEATSSLDALEGFEFNRLAKFNTPPKNAKGYDLTTPGWGHDIYNCYFFPNPVATVRNKGRRTTYKHANKMKLAGLFFLPVDIDFDFDNGFGYEEAMELIDALPIKPDVIVYTGNGIQAYWSIEHSYIFPSSNRLVYPDTELQFQSSTNVEQRAVTLLRAITGLVKGDQGPSHAARGLMRVPETYNFKIRDGKPHVTKGHYISGNLEDAYHNPKHTFEELASCYCPEISKECNSATTLEDEYQYQIEKRPLPRLEDLDLAFKKLCDTLDIQKPSKNLYRFFKIPYGYRFLYRYMEHRESNQKTSGLNRRDLKEQRDFFLSYDLIEKLSDHKRTERISAFYRPTRKFFQAIGEDPPFIEIDIRVISTGIYPTGRFNTLVISDIEKLNQLQISNHQKQEIIIKKIENSPDLSHKEDRIERARLLLMD